MRDYIKIIYEHLKKNIYSNFLNKPLNAIIRPFVGGGEVGRNSSRLYSTGISSKGGKKEEEFARELEAGSARPTRPAYASRARPSSLFPLPLL